MVQAIGEWRADEVYVDVIGVGAGVYDRLRELAAEQTVTAKVYAVNVAASAPERTTDEDAQGKTLRDHLWLLLWRWLRMDAPVFAADREAGEDLAGELSTVRYAPDSSGRLVIESKDAMKARGLRSPDVADALAVTFAPQASMVACDVIPPRFCAFSARRGSCPRNPHGPGAGTGGGAGEPQSHPSGERTAPRLRSQGPQGRFVQVLDAEALEDAESFLLVLEDEQPTNCLTIPYAIAVHPSFWQGSTRKD